MKEIAEIYRQVHGEENTHNTNTRVYVHIQHQHSILSFFWMGVGRGRHGTRSPCTHTCVRNFFGEDRSEEDAVDLLPSAPERWRHRHRERSRVDRRPA